MKVGGDIKVAAKEIIQAIALWRIWLMLAWQDIRLRYRRSAIGPFWLTLSMAVTIYSMGFLYAKLFRVDLSLYYPYLTTGMICWQLISAIITESTMGFISADVYLKEIRLPPSIFVMRILCRNFIIFLHNLPVYIPILLIFHIKLHWSSLLIFPGLLLLLINGFIYGSLLAMIGARFRDFTQILTSLIQVIFFLTPIMWQKQVLPPQYQFIVTLNPFEQFLDLIRQPLLGQPIELYSYLFAGALAVIGAILFVYMYQRYRSRIIYWL